MEALYTEIDSIYQAISRTETNFKKIGKANINTTVVKGRLELLNQRWRSAQTLDLKLQTSISAEDKLKSEYFQRAQFLKVEEAYLHALDYLNCHLHQLTSNTNQNSQATASSGQDTSIRSESTQVKLPQVSLPEFSGKYTEWENFRDLFQALIIQNESLAQVTRLHYLKTSLKGEASQLLKHIPITNSSFIEAWNILKERYDNNRSLISAHIQTLMDVPRVNNNSFEGLKLLYNTVNEALAALKNLKRKVDDWDDLLVYIITSKLDSQSLKEWEMQLGVSSNYPTYKKLEKFLIVRIRALEAIQAAKLTFDKSKNSNFTFVKSHTASTTSKCFLCKENHPLYKCDQFKALSVERRKEVAQSNNCCFNCLLPGHKPYNCMSKFTCLKCRRKHNTLLHYNNKFESKSNSSLVSGLQATVDALKDDFNESNTVMTNCGHVSTTDLQFSHNLNLHKMECRSTLLATALVDVRAENGNIHKFKILLDQGSESSFVSERAVNILKPNYSRINALVSGMGGVSVGIVKKLAHFQLLPKEEGCKALELSALVMYKLTDYHPPSQPCDADLSDLKSISLADPNFFHKQQIDFIVGADRYGACLLPGLRQGICGSLTAQATIFGWILSGRGAGDSQPLLQSLSVHHSVSMEVLHDELVKFWQLKEPPTVSSLTEEEKMCEQHFVDTHQRLVSGRYMVRLPFKNGPPIKIGSSLYKSRIVLDRILCHLKKDPQYLKQYTDFLTEYEQLGHMKSVEILESDSDQVVYLPHHSVLRQSSSTTKLRVVFNASSLTTDNTSLNSHLHVGPLILNDLISILLRWRIHRYVFIADCEKMFRQILIDPRDVDYQRILWRDVTGKLISYQLLTVTYGTACAPYLANRVVKQLALDEGQNFPLAKPVLEECIYVDDMLFGDDDLSSANILREQVLAIMEKGGFHLRKWASNSVDLLKNCAVGEHEQALEFQSEQEMQLKVLGLTWDPSTDSFSICVNLDSIEFPTKRIVLSIISRLYDPLGWITPVLVRAKLFMQELWLRKLDWDERLPSDLLNQWYEYYNDLISLKNLRIPRWIGSVIAGSRYELHAFSDASNRAYAACIYLRMIDNENNVHITLLLSKSRVAPIKPVSIPRLELCAAVLLAKVLKFVVTTMKFDSVKKFCHTDSNVVLAWLGKHPSTWKSFVANRVALIHELVPEAQWVHVSSENNSADCASRGLLPKEIVTHSLWWQGPNFLSDQTNSWLHSENLGVSSDLEKSTDLELKKIKIHNVLVDQVYDNELINRFSSWPKLLRVASLCLRFIGKCRLKEKTESGPLSTIEVDRTRLVLIKLVQGIFFSSEINELSQIKTIQKKSSIRSLTPFLDKDGIVRVGGRLSNAPIAYDAKHPIILPRHKLSELIARHAHLRCLHGGIQLTLHTLRQNYWITGARLLIKNIINNCLPCVREKAAITTQLMGDLPEFRVTPSRPFTHTGIDYAGPFDIHFNPGRGQRSRKTYVALFVCCYTRAIHLELVSDYTSAAFLAAFHRFVSRRGRPSHLYSDNGTNFVGAERELKKCLIELRKDVNLIKDLNIEGTSWKFIPPSAPHFGGLWEAGVKSMKQHLRKIVGKNKFTFEEFYTLLTRIEASLNSRPIAALSNDAEDFSYLTPGHLLIGAPLNAIPEPSVEFTPENRLTRWGLIQRVLEIFWRKWTIDYLHSLQKRHKWTTLKSNISIGDMVLIKQDNLPPCQWLLGRIVKCYKGKDDLIRVVRVKTVASEFDRPISKICLLPIKSSDP